MKLWALWWNRDPSVVLITSLSEKYFCVLSCFKIHSVVKGVKTGCHRHSSSHTKVKCEELRCTKPYNNLNLSVRSTVILLDSTPIYVNSSTRKSLDVRLPAYPYIDAMKRSHLRFKSSSIASKWVLVHSCTSITADRPFKIVLAEILAEVGSAEEVKLTPVSTMLCLTITSERTSQGRVIKKTIFLEWGGGGGGTRRDGLYTSIIIFHLSFCCRKANYRSDIQVVCEHSLSIGVDVLCFPFVFKIRGIN